MTRTSKSGHQGSPEGAPQGALFLFNIDPVPASRPRVTRWGTYHTKTYKTWLTAAAECLKNGPIAGQPVPDGVPLVVVAEFVCRKPRTTKLVTPKGDIDNYLKAPLDALTHAGAWGDDKWITTVIASKRFAEPGEEPHTTIRVYAKPPETLFGRLAAGLREFLRCA